MNIKNKFFISQSPRMLRLRDNKAILLPEALKIILAVISIGMLLYLLVSLYSIFVGKTRLEQARETLNQIVAKINVMDEGDVEEFLIQSPKESFFVYFDKETSGSRCSGGNCLCICLDSNNKETCGINDGVCKEAKFEVQMEKVSVQGMEQFTDWYPINAPTQIILEKKNNQIFIKTSLEIAPELKPTPEQIKKSELAENLLIKKINYNGEEILFETFVEKNLLGDCKFNSKQDADKEIKDEVEEFSLEYINEIKEKELVKGRVAVVYAYGLKKFIETDEKKLVGVEFMGYVSGGGDFYIGDVNEDTGEGLEYPNLDMDYISSDSKDSISRKLICENEQRAYFVFILGEKNE